MHIRPYSHADLEAVVEVFRSNIPKYFGLSEEELDEYFPSRELKPLTSNTIADREELKKHLKKVAEQGYAIDDEELDVGVRCVSAPIRDYTRRIVGALSISGPAMRLSLERLEKELIPLAIKASDEISTKLGFHK
jgi:DNA-binding IclR family transcriptional regulator